MERACAWTMCPSPKSLCPMSSKASWRSCTWLPWQGASAKPTAHGLAASVYMHTCNVSWIAAAEPTGAMQPDVLTDCSYRQFRPLCIIIFSFSFNCIVEMHRWAQIACKGIICGDQGLRLDLNKFVWPNCPHCLPPAHTTQSMATLLFPQNTKP